MTFLEMFKTFFRSNRKIFAQNLFYALFEKSKKQPKFI